MDVLLTVCMHPKSPRFGISFPVSPNWSWGFPCAQLAPPNPPTTPQEGREPLSCVFCLIYLVQAPHSGHFPLNLQNLLLDGAKHPLYSLASKIHLSWDSIDCSGHLSEDQLKIRAGGTSKWAQLPPTWPLSSLSCLFLKFCCCWIVDVLCIFWLLMLVRYMIYIFPQYVGFFSLYSVIWCRKNFLNTF